MKGKTVVITGASSGIGKALAYEFAARGSKVVMGARNVDQLKEIAEDIRQQGGEVAFAQTNVTVEDECKNLIDLAVKNFGQVDVLINNAGISMRALFNDADVSVIKRLMDVNFWGTVYCTKSALPHLLKNKGSVVAVSSIAGIKGLPGRTGYSASKFAIHGFMESLRIENLKTGLHVLMAYPGFTSSNIRNAALVADGKEQGNSPLDEGKIMSAEEVAKHIYKAVKNKKTSLVLTTQGKLTVFLSKFFSSVLDKIVFNHMAKEPDSPFK
ncbi:MAG: SDR family oxidoreductase [Bacteroidales bacterium]|nr:SDR family oxidoreductase [Bacteroidales bacterium]